VQRENLKPFFTTPKFKKMKYLLKILLLCVAFIPISLWFILVYIWTFDSSELKQLWHDFKETIDYNYRRAFGYGKRRGPRTFVIAFLIFASSCSQPITRDSKCYQACEPIPGEYQIKLGPDYIKVYDGPRFIDSLSYYQLGDLEELLITDNQ
jgi:hypothetical protein